MKKVFMVHGFGGEPNGGWRPWLMGKLALLDVWAYALAMPTPDEPKKDEWVAEITRSIGEPNEDVVLVGHSLGVPAVLRYIESLPEGSVLGGAVLVSGVIHVIPGKERYEKINHFYDKDFNFNHIKKICKKFTIIHGDNDPAVPFSHAQDLAREFSCELISIPNGGHLNGSSGHRELPEALIAIEKILS